MVKPDTKGDGSVWEIAFSRDPQQKFLYISDGANENIHVFDRQSMKELYWFGGGGRQPGQFYAVHRIVTDAKATSSPPRPIAVSGCRSSSIRE